MSKDWECNHFTPVRSKTSAEHEVLSQADLGEVALRTFSRLLRVDRQICPAFLAEVPELSGCAADGATYQEALSNVQVVIREWIETAEELGRPIPVPRGRLIYA